MKQFSNNVQKLTSEEIISVYSQGNKYDVMLDGIINQKEFDNASFKILWIMKEPYGALPKHISSGIQERIAGTKTDSLLTWKRIALTNYRILKCCKSLTQEPNWTLYGKSLDEIAIINLKKTAGKSTTNMNQLSNFFNNHGDQKYVDIILRQLDQVQPDIVIGAKTLNILKPYLRDTQDLEFGHFSCNKTIFINTYHPAQRKLGNLEYANIIGKRIDQFINS